MTKQTEKVYLKYMSKFLSIKIVMVLIVGLSLHQAKAQTILDKTIAVVGDNYILQSELEYRFREEYIVKGIDSREAKCALFFKMLQEKMLIVQAKRDSIVVAPEEVDMQMEQRLGFFIQQFGSEKEIEKFFDESMKNIRIKLRKSMEHQMLISRVNQSLIGGVTVSPKSVKSYYKGLNKDSLPFLETKFELGQVLVKVKVSDLEKKRVKRKLNKIRQQVIDGEMEWSIAATLYSEDPGSKNQGGDLGWASRNAYVPEFAAAAFKLKKDSISGPILSEFGYHIIKMLDRRGDRIHVKHILISPTPRPENRKFTKNKLDSVWKLVKLDSITFKQAAYRYSEDEETKNTGGMLYDQRTGSTQIEKTALDESLIYMLDTMKVGSISKPIFHTPGPKKEAYRLIYLKNKIPAHSANLDSDYSYIADLAKEQASIDFLNDWVWKKAPTMYIKITEGFDDCKKVQRLIQENKKLN